MNELKELQRLEKLKDLERLLELQDAAKVAYLNACKAARVTRDAYRDADAKATAAAEIYLDAVEEKQIAAWKGETE